MVYPLFQTIDEFYHSFEKDSCNPISISVRQKNQSLVVVFTFLKKFSISIFFTIVVSSIPYFNKHIVAQILLTNLSQIIDAFHVPSFATALLGKRAINFFCQKDTVFAEYI